MHQSGLPGIDSNATFEEEEEEIHRIFRETFSTESGKVCLNFLLNDLLYFDVAKNESEQALCNYAKVLVNKRLGIVDTIDITNNMLASIKDK